MDKIPNLNHLSPDLLHPSDLQKEDLPRIRRPWKLLTLEITGVIFAAVAGYFGGEAIKGGLFTPALALGIIFFAVSTLRIFFEADLSRRFLAGLVETAVYFGFAWLAYAVSFGFLFTGFLVALIFGVWGEHVATSDAADRLRIAPFSLSRHKISRLMTGYLLAGIILSMPIWAAAPLPIPERQFQALFKGGVRVAGIAVPGVRFDSTVTDFAGSVAKKELMDDKNFQQLAPDMQDKAIREASAQMITEAEKNLSMKLPPDAQVSDIFYKYLAATVGKWKASFGNYFNALWILAIFIFLRGIAVILVYVSSLINVILYESLLAFGFAAVLGENATKEQAILT